MEHGRNWLTGAAFVVALAVALILLVSGGRPSLAEDGVIYVDSDATGPVYDGNSWETAFTDLQAALDTAKAGDEIWVAAGVYTPTWQFDAGDPHSATFQMVNEVAIYGGFVGTETVRGLRDWVANPTILSGDLNGDDGDDFVNNDENSYHVFYHPDGTGLDDTAILDGFTISGGNANGTWPHTIGGGMYNYSSSPSLRNCTFRDSSASGGGAGMYNHSSSPALTDCTFEGNSASSGGGGSGGGMYNEDGASPVLTNCTFSGNSAWSSNPAIGDAKGGGMYNSGSSPVLTHCTFSDNSAMYGGGMNNNNSAPTLTNCIFAGNVGGGMYNYGGASPILTGCIFSGNQDGGMRNTGSSPTLIGCTFSENSAGSGGGMYNTGSSPSLTNCTFADNQAIESGGGIHNTTSSSPVLTDCTFSGNSASFGGGMANYYSSSPVLTDCTFSGNSAEYGGGMYNDGSTSTSLTNCIFWGNSAGWGGGLANYESSPTLANCTISGNSADYGGGMINAVSSPTLTNCILWGNTPEGVYYSDEVSSATITYSDVQGDCDADPLNVCGDGNINDDPLFVDVAAGDLRLQLTSPAIDAGDNEAAALADVTTDLDCHPRFANVDSVPDTGNGTAPIVDMGAYEAPPEVIFVDLDAAGEDDGTSWDDAFTDLQEALAWTVNGVQVWVAEGTYKPTWKFDTGAPRSATFQMVNGVAIYGGFDPSTSDTSWIDRDWVANPTILSGDIGEEGNPDDNSYHVFYHPEGADLDSSAVLDGFTISGGNASDTFGHTRGGGMYNNASSPTLTNVDVSGNSAYDYGGGMHNINNSSPTLTDCTFSDNSAMYGGGMNNNNSAPTLTDCIFAGNVGGGMYNYASASPLLTNCTFSGNWDSGMRNTGSSPTLIGCTFSENSAGSGGGMYNNASSPTLINCTFSGNSAAFAGGMYNSGSSPVLTNCTFSGNSSSLVHGGAMISYGGSPVLINCILWGDTPPETYGDEMVVTYSDVQGDYEGEGNINEDPLFADADSADFHLLIGSPCIDAGTNAASYIPLYDFEGDARIMDGDSDGTATVDMGVDEALWHPVYLPLVLRGD